MKQISYKEAEQLVEVCKKNAQKCVHYLENRKNLYVTVEKHMKSKTDPAKADETVVIDTDAETGVTPKEVLHTLDLYVEEIYRIHRGIAEGKLRLDFDLDAEKKLLKVRREYLEALQSLQEAEPFEETKEKTGYYINADGNEGQYTYLSTVKHNPNFSAKVLEEHLEQIRAEILEEEMKIARGEEELTVEWESVFGEGQLVSGTLLRIVKAVVA